MVEIKSKKPRTKISSVRGRRVLVAMSGGVDSSVAATLLKKEGYEVEGAYMKNFSPESWQGVISKDCPWEAEMKDVEQVCKILGIKWRSFNFEEEYQDNVIDYFFDEYALGRTPNPDVMCNKEIKFGIFLQKAKELGFDYIATGHYVRRQEFVDLEPIRYSLMTAVDENKDQSYFLWALTQEQLKYCLFPISDYTKPQVRKLAREFGLPNSEKKDSQGLCFVGHIKLKDFLNQRLPQKQGVVALSDGKVIGKHDGIYPYTIGQRKGIGLPGGPYFVIDKNPFSKILTITNDEKDLYKKDLVIENVNWISGKQPDSPSKVYVKIRYRAKSVPVTIYKLSTNYYELIFKEPQRAIAPGQSAVFYLKDEMLGGGIIQ